MTAPCTSAWATLGLCHEFLNTYYIFNQIQQRRSWWFHLPSALVETSAHRNVVKKTNLWFELYTCSQNKLPAFYFASASVEAAQNYWQQHGLKREVLSTRLSSLSPGTCLAILPAAFSSRPNSWESFASKLFHFKWLCSGSGTQVRAQQWLTGQALGSVSVSNPANLNIFLRTDAAVRRAVPHKAERLRSRHLTPTLRRSAVHPRAGHGAPNHPSTQFCQTSLRF